MKLSKKEVLEWAGIIALLVGIQFAVNLNLPSGEPPPLAGQTLEGRPFDLAQMQGGPSVIYFWASWCPICRGMQSSVGSIAKDHPLVGVALQSGTEAELGKYMAEQGFHIPTLPDPDGSLTERYGLRGVPAIFVLGPEGKIRYATTGYTSEIGIRIRLWLAGL